MGTSFTLQLVRIPADMGTVCKAFIFLTLVSIVSCFAGSSSSSRVRRSPHGSYYYPVRYTYPTYTYPTYSYSYTYPYTYTYPLTYTNPITHTHHTSHSHNLVNSLYSYSSLLWGRRRRRSAEDIRDQLN